MMDKEMLDRAIEKTLPSILEDVKGMRELNAKVPVSGKRYMLPLKGREIGIVYYPAEAENAPLILGLHGGGFLFGGSALDDDLWVNVVKMLEVNVASIDYRMSPEVMDEDCLYDVYDSMKYLISHAQEYGFDPERVSVFGTSAGGNLAAALAILVKQRGEMKLKEQMLLYPFLDGYTDPDKKGEGSFTGLLPHLMNRLHFSEGRADDPLLSPYYATKEMLTGLAKAIVVYCENDNLRPEAERYVEMLREAGVETAEMLAEKMPHAYIESGFKKHLTDLDIQMLGEGAEEMINSGLLRKTCEDTLRFIKLEM